MRDEAWLASVEAQRVMPDTLSVWWLGQSGFLVQWRGRHLLFDPYLSDSLTHKYANTDKPHIRMSERVIAPERLGFVDVVTSSHNHTDHLDAKTILPIRRANPSLAMVIPEANRAFVAGRLGAEAEWPIGLVDGASVHVAGFTVTGVPAAHNDLATDSEGRNLYMGYVVTCGPWTLYHSGDTLWYPGMEDDLKAWSIDLAFLPINGNKPERRVAGNLDGREAALLAKAIGAKHVIPCHYDMFTFNTASPVTFTQTCASVGQAHTVMALGACWSRAGTSV